MARRDWLLILGSASVCLLAGCLRNSLNPEVQPPRRPPAEIASRLPPPVFPTQPRSDYQLTTPERSEQSEARAEPPPEPPPGPEVVIREEAQSSPVQATVVARPKPEAAAPARLPEKALEPEGPPEPPTPSKPAPDPPVVQALCYLLDQHPDKAADLLRRYDSSQQELLQALLPLVARSSQAGLEHASAEELTTLLNQVNAVAQALRARAPLALDHRTFCSCIRNFGDYEPLPPCPQFQAGMDGHPGERLQVYVEVRNFTSRPRGPYHETTLSSRLEIMDFHRQVVWFKDFEPCVDRSRSPRQDYFINFQFFLPPRIPQGDYTLRVQVWDGPRPKKGRPAPRAAECSLDFGVQGNADRRATGEIRPPHRSELDD